MITDKEEYYKQKAIDYQSRIVNYKSCTTSTSDAFVWTYRTTNCDVVSIITTIVPVKDGLMKDVKINTGEVKRLKPPNIKRSSKDVLANSPYDFGLSVDLMGKRRRMNKTLQDEKKEFMAKLHLTRFVRSKLENDAATKIQSLYRGHYVRSSLQEIQYYASVHQMIRSNLRAYLQTVGYATISLHQFKQTRDALRNKAAELIQSGFFRYLARCSYRRKLYERMLDQRTNSAIKIQAMIRGVYARLRIRAIMSKNMLVKKLTSVIKIQRTYRAMLARRRVRCRRFKLHWIACKIIQSWYRATYSRRMAMHIKSIMQKRRANTNALKIQLCIRKFLSKRRVFRIRYRALYQKITKATIRIQTMIRKFLAKVFVQQKRQERLKKREEDTEREKAEEARKAAALEAEQNEQLLQSSNMFLQAELGRIADVEDIYLGLLTGEVHVPDEVNEESGETLLLLAARKGNVDLVRKCLLWGFDINFRNEQGHHAIMIAAKHDHLPIVQYLSSFILTDPTATSGDGAEISAAPVNTTDAALANVHLLLTEDDVGYLFVMAVANTAENHNNLAMLNLFLSLGLNINADSAYTTGMKAIHTACEIGNEEIFQFLIKNKAKYLDGDNNLLLDDLGQSCLHKAATSSLAIVQWILGLDPNYHTYMHENVRVANILLPDIDNKTALLLAILSGQTKIVYLLEHVIAVEGKFVYETYNHNDPAAQKNPSPTASSSSAAATTPTAPGGINHDEITWTLPDIHKAFLLVQQSNLYCMKKLIDQYQYDVNWTLDIPTEDEGPREAIYEEFYSKSLMMIACQVGDVDMLDVLMQAKGNLALLDCHQQNVFHYCILHHAHTTSGSGGHNATESAQEIGDLLEQVMHQFYDDTGSGKEGPSGNATPRNKSTTAEPAASSVASSSSSAPSSSSVSLIAFILTHPQRLACQVTPETTPSLLLQTNHEQENIFHLAAKYNHSYEFMKMDLFFSETLLETAFTQRNHHHMTPFIVACAYQHLTILLYYLKLHPASILDRVYVPDRQRHFSGLHYLLHTPSWVLSTSNVSKGSKSAAHKRVFVSEYHLYGPNATSSSPTAVATTTPTGNAAPAAPTGGASAPTNYSREENLRLQQEISIVLLFLRPSIYHQDHAPLHLYSSEIVTQEEIVRYDGQYPRPVISSGVGIPDHVEIGDVLIQEYAWNCLKALLYYHVVAYHDAWRLVLSSIRYDTKEGNLKMLYHLFRCGIMDVLVQQHGVMTINNNHHNNVLGGNDSVADSLSLTTAEDNLPNESSIISASTGNTRSSFINKSSSMKFSSVKISATRSGPINTLPSSNAAALVSFSSMSTYNLPDASQITRLQDTYYEGINLMGWSIRFHHIKCMQWLLKKGYDVTVSIENVFYEPSLHYIVRHGIPEMVDIVKGDKRLRWEMVNDEGMTAAMIAAKEHKIRMAKRLFAFKADARKALQARYAGWVLAWARKLERNEVNTQTGRTGEDDDRYFPMIADPYYSIWYSQ